MQLAAEKRASTASVTATNEPIAAKETGTLQVSAAESGERQSMERTTILVLKSNQTYEVAKYQRDGDLLMFVDTQGRKGGVDVNEVDWRKTSEMTGAVRSSEQTLLSRQTN